MTPDPLLLRVLLIASLASAGACGREPPPPAIPPGPVRLPSVSADPPLPRLAAAPEVLVIGRDTVRLEAELSQNYMPGPCAYEDGCQSTERSIAGELKLRSTSVVVAEQAAAGMRIVDAWVVMDGRAERMPLDQAGSRTWTRTRGFPRVERTTLVVQLRSASGRLRLLRREAEVSRVE